MKRYEADHRNHRSSNAFCTPWRRSVVGVVPFAVLASCALACTSSKQSEKAIMADGDYRVSWVHPADGGTPEQVADLQAITVSLQRSDEHFVLKLPDGSQEVYSFVSRPESQWRGDCCTMDGCILDEAADLSPAPLAFGYLSFSTPLLYAKCNENVLIVANGLVEQEGEQAVGLRHTQ